MPNQDAPAKPEEKAPQENAGLCFHLASPLSLVVVLPVDPVFFHVYY